MSYVSHDGLAYFKHKLDQKFISNITSEDGALKIVLGDGTVLKNIQDTTVTQKKSTANELYPLLLCYDAMADQDQLSKETWFGQHILANPYYGYLASRGMYVKHPTFNRRNGVSQKVEWAYDFTDAVSGLGNPMSQVYAYVDPAAQGGEHCIELRLYGNPNVSPVVPSVNDSTNTFSIGVGVTGGNVQFGYCPSTPLYLDDGSTLRTEATGHGNDIITRDWLNLNGSFTGLVHTTMNETIDGAKTFKKTVTINSGDNNNKAGLYVQGNSDIHGNEHVYGTETVDGKLTANGTAEIKGGSGNTPSLTVTGDEKVTGNSNITGNETVGGNISTTNGNISTTNGTVSGKTGVIGSGGLTVNGNETVTGEIYKIVNNTPQEYVSYVTNKTETKTTIVNNLIKDKGGLAVDSNKNIYVNTGKGLTIDTVGKVNVDFSQMPTQDVANVVSGMVAPGSGLVADSSTGKLAVDFSQMPTDKFEALLKGLKMKVPLDRNMTIYVDINHSAAADNIIDGRGTQAKPFKHINAAVAYVTTNYALANYRVYICIAAGTYPENVTLPAYDRGTGSIVLYTASGNRDVTIVCQPTNIGICGFGISATGGVWELRHVEVRRTETANTDPGGGVGGCIASNGAGTSVRLLGCSIVQSIPSTPIGGETYTLRIFAADNGGEIKLAHGSVAHQISTQSFSNSSPADLSVFCVSRGGILHLEHNTDTTLNNEVICSGSCDVFLQMWQNGIVKNSGSGRIITFVNNNVTGKRYTLADGSYVTGTGGSTTFFPGSDNENNTIEASTYCWYK